MYGTVTTYLSRRATEGPDDFFKDMDLSPATVGLVVAQAVVFIVSLMLVNYTLDLILALTAVEDANQRIELISDTKDPKDTANLLDSELVVTAPQKPITSKIRTTMQHLRAEAGYLSRYRGMAIALCTHVARSVLINILFPILGGRRMLSQGYIVAFSWETLVNLVAPIIASIVLARWTMAWTHIVVTEPHSKPWYCRIPSWSSWKKIWAPTAFTAFTYQLSAVLPAALMTMALGSDEALSCGLVAKVLAAFCLRVVIVIGLYLPAQVSLTRMQASLLPEDARPIVPFDKSFGGKVVPESLGGTGYLSFADSWRTFDVQSRKRYLSMFLKSCFVVMVLSVLFSLVLALELWQFSSEGFKNHLQSYQETGIPPAWTNMLV